MCLPSWDTVKAGSFARDIVQSIQYQAVLKLQAEVDLTRVDSEQVPGVRVAWLCQDKYFYHV